jgi:iron complex transport system permease protein
LTIKQRMRRIRSDVSLSEISEKVAGDGDTAESVFRQYKAFRYTKTLFLVGSLILLFILIGVKLGIGSYPISFGDVYSTLWHHLTGDVQNYSYDNIVWNQRMPRLLTAIFVGIGLSAAGAAMQSMMKNPMADPYTTGISSGALFGATLAMTLGITLIDGYYGRILNAFIFAMVPAIIILVIAKWRRPTPAMMILIGIAVMYIFNAFQAFMMLTADPNSASAVYTWSVGSIGMTTWEQIPLLATVSLLGTIALCFCTKSLNALNSGDSYAKSLGINVDRFRILIMILVSLIAAGTVSFTGVIGFIGLVSPHIARIFVGSDNRILLPTSAIVGACMMVFCDIVGYLVAGYSLQIGIITAMIGGPLFLILIMAQRKEAW